MIHLLVHEARNLKISGEDTVDPIVEAKCFKVKKFTSAKDDIGYNSLIQWNEHIFFEPTDLKPRDIHNGKLSIRILDQQMLKNAVVGSYEIDLSYIYFKEKHAIFNQWVGISNPTSQNFNELAGYLKISVSVIGPGDEQIPLTDLSGLDHTEKEVMLLPPHISLKYYQMKFRLIKAQKLPKMDTFGTCDAFVSVNYLGKQIRTSVITQKNDEVFWAQEIWIPVQYPLVSSRIVMTVFDEDQASNDVVGSMSFDIKKIIELGIENGEFPWLWKDIYSAPSGCSGKYTDEMDAIPEIASAWRGRILMQVTAEETENPEMKVRRVDQDTIQNAANHFSLKWYDIKAEIRQGICLPSESKYKIKIKIADFETVTEKPKKYSKGFCYWNHQFKAKRYECPYQSVESMADVILYLMDGDSPI